MYEIHVQFHLFTNMPVKFREEVFNSLISLATWSSFSFDLLIRATFIPRLANCNNTKEET